MIPRCDRPKFPNADAYIDHVRAAIKTGQDPWAPSTRQELEAAVETFPGWRQKWIPTPEILELMGLPAWFGRDVPPFDDEWQETFLATLEVDDDFRQAVKVLLGVA